MFHRLLFLNAFLLLITTLTASSSVSLSQPWLLDSTAESRSISFENPTGEKGKGGMAASNLGVGRKGSPAKSLAPGETLTFCEIDGPGVIRHIWMTTREDNANLRGLVIRAWWDGQEHPSIECPLGDLMGFAHGECNAYQSAVHSVGPRAGMNLWLPMPFASHARMTITNEREEGSRLYYQIDYTLGDSIPPDAGRLHVCFRRENPTTLGQDFEILPKREGKGRFLGCILGIRAKGFDWWGEGEVKFYLDGDTEFPTICGTGSEDYVGLSWGMQEVPFLYNGCSYNRNGTVSMYRWHLPDPIRWKKDIRVTIQQLGGYTKNFVDRQDDWSTATFWYEPVPSAPLPPFPDLQARLANLPRPSLLDQQTGNITAPEAIRLLLLQNPLLSVEKVLVNEGMGYPLYQIQGKEGDIPFNAYVDARATRVLGIERKGASYIFPGVVVVAHRGASKFAPENTLAAFRKAIELGVDRIEMDVRQTRDGHLVILHDSTVDRTTNGTGKISEMTLEEVRQLDAGTWFSPDFAGEKIPTLDEALAEIKGKALPAIDYKEGDPARLIASLQTAGFLSGATIPEITVYSGNIERLNQLKQLEARLAFAPPTDLGENGLAALVQQIDPPVISVDWWQFSEEYIKQIHLLGKRAFVDTLGLDDDELSMMTAIQGGADIIQTDHLDILLPLLREMGFHQ